MRIITPTNNGPVDPHSRELDEIKAHVKEMEKAGLQLQADVEREFGIMMVENAKLAKIIKDCYPHVNVARDVDLMKRIEEVVKL